MYFPSDDSIFLSNVVNHYHGQLALEIGTSTGIILKELSKNFRIVIGTDIDFDSLKRAQSVLKNDRLICCDAASALHEVRFDLIVTNPPYLPNNPNQVDKTVDGGPTGIEVSIHILTSALDKLARNGKILILVSNLSDKRKLEIFASENNLVMNQIAQKEIFYEILEIIEISRQTGV
ncbi:MAG TPA: methyltransferase domain-containing protein [Nitrososphaeraceae archaeon]|nr:methyltransferase domain-containing protein [Nitrososphaeraceae archaeon]